jgi:hypothetical protein
MTLQIPSPEGKYLDFTFEPRQTLDLGQTVSPYDLDTSYCQQLHAARAEGRISVLVIPGADDFSKPLQPSGGGGPTQVSITPFSPPTQILAALAYGNTVTEVSVLVTTPFNVPTTLSLGTSATPTIIMGPTDSNLNSAGEYQSEATFLVTVPDNLILTLSFSGVPTIGNVTLFYTLTT